ncbi:MAG: PIG-L family deacetylase [Tissierellales bacterium]|jgi:LmbE family N-acetylglucosaminyl deacetylase|nr:PIG-L family deacetylase [Tissierellales bacterium]
MVKTIVGVFAHPDDEISSAGLLERAINVGRNVHLICATRGEAGKVNNNVKGHISDIRTKELEESCELLGAASLNFLEVGDGKSETWVATKVEEKLYKMIKDIDPDIIITFDKNGGNGHPDHKEISRITQNVFDRINDINKKLYFVSLFPKSFMRKKLCLLPISKNRKEHFYKKFAVEDDQVSFMIKLNRKELKKKLNLVKCHRSQFPDTKGRYYKVPLSIFKIFARYECFYCKDLKQEELDNLEFF